MPVAQYYPIEVSGNNLRLFVFNFQIRSTMKNGAGQIVASCYEARSNTANMISDGLDRMLKVGDTIITQNAYIALKRF